MKNLSLHIDSSAIDISAVMSKDAVFARFAKLAAKVYALDERAALDGLSAREKLGSTGFGGGVAIPHAKLSGLDRCVGLFLRCEHPIAFNAHDAQPVDIVFCLLSPEKAGAEHLRGLAEVSRFLRDEQTVAKLRGAASSDALYVLLSGQQEQQAA